MVKNETDKVASYWGRKFRDLSILGSAIVALIVVGRSIGDVYVQRRINEEQSEAIRNITASYYRLAEDYQQHKLEHARYVERVDAALKRIDVCCPFSYMGK